MTARKLPAHSADDLRAFEQAAIDAARRGGEVLRRRFREGSSLRVVAKGLHDFVTEVDHQAEAAVVEALRSRYPGHAFLTEEGSPRDRSAGLRWVVDPLDGTTNFIHGVPTFAVSVALEDELGVLAGAICDPIHDETFHAFRGGGARMNGQPMACTPLGDLHDALIATGFPFRELSRLDGYLDAFERFVRSTSGLRRAGSAALDLAFVACGRYDGFFEVGLSRWDVAAGCLLVAEAGGSVSDVLGGAAFLDGDVVASGAGLHAAMLEVTAQAFAPRARG